MSQRVLYVTDSIAPYRNGGMPEVARRHIDWLVNAGLDVIAIHSWVEAPVSTPPPFRLVHLDWPSRRSWDVINPARYTNQLRRFSAAVIPLIEQYTPDLVYSEGPLIAQYLDVPRNARVPTIFHPHGLNMFQRGASMIDDLKARPLHAIMKYHMLNADLVLSQGGRLEGIFNDLGVDERKRAFVPNSVPSGFPVASHPRRCHSRRFLFVGRSAPEKGLALLLRAFSTLSSGTLEIVGEAAKTAPSSRIRYMGAVHDRAALRAIYDTADFLVVPSLREGMPTVILEAFSAGIPVIASDVGAVSELVHDGITGFLVKSGSALAVRDALKRAAALTPDEYTKMSGDVLRVVNTSFSEEAVRARFLAAVGSQLSNGLGVSR